MFENISTGRISDCSKMYVCDVFLKSVYDGIVSRFSLLIARHADNFTTLVAAMNRFLLLDNIG